MGDIDGKGILIGIVVWVALISIMVSEMACVKYDRCGTDDLMLLAVISVGLAIPSAIVALLTSKPPATTKK